MIIQQNRTYSSGGKQEKKPLKMKENGKGCLWAKKLEEEDL